MSGISGYYDMDAILSEDERIPCVFTLDAVGMGVLDPTTAEDDLAEGTKVHSTARWFACRVLPKLLLFLMLLVCCCFGWFASRRRGVCSRF